MSQVITGVQLFTDFTLGAASTAFRFASCDDPASTVTHTEAWP
ncbi:hypothetical protein [Streptomyces scabiei]